MLNKFAISNETNEIIYISDESDLPRGKACNCRCPECGKPMVVKYSSGKPRSKSTHFAHLSGSNCSPNAGNETAIHLMAKDIIAESGRIILPAYYVDATEDSEFNPSDSYQCESYKVFDAKELLYMSENVEKEVNMGGITPDIVVSVKGKSNAIHTLGIEIAVTHFIDDEKKKKITDRDFSTLEIDLAAIWKELNTQDSFDESKLKYLLIEEVTNKHWIHNSLKAKGVEGLKHRNRLLNVAYLEYQSYLELAIRNEKRCYDVIKNRIAYDVCKRCRNHSKAISYYESINHNDEFYVLTKQWFNGIPYFCDKYIKDGFVFKCDRRIWQLYVFNNYVFRKSVGSYISVVEIYKDIKANRKEWINSYYINLGEKECFLGFDGDNLIKAIYNYLQYLAVCGFVKFEGKTEYPSLHMPIVDYHYNVKNNRFNEQVNNCYE